MALTIYELSHLPQFNQPIYILGSFEAFHLGHYELLKSAQSLTANSQRDLVLVFFADCEHLPKNQTIFSDLNFRAQAFADLNFEHAIALNYQHLAHWNPQEFIDALVANQTNVDFVCGEDFRFGFRASGSPATLKDRFGADKVHVVSQLKVANKKISTTLLKESLEQGEIELVNNLNMYKYGFSASFTTTSEQEFLVTKADDLVNLKHGVYIVNVEIGEFVYYAVLKYQYNTQAWIKFLDFNFNIDILVNCTIQFIKALRFFDTTAEVITKQDLIEAKNFFISITKTK
ncbi:FAD synthase [Mycoplasmopsis columbinasalis]|uniref:FAD synthase n=1 Tax=Mycoplasmopsis columbinasalis TaxID=114880 RepID=A0A449BAP5_9BACT|nr:riboflavin biosynthesis protein [Mycoplasmopsis columbinasalis]VEU78271.1 riboflavin kinase [Mycoplasmopsis columbinasalis]